MALDYAKAYQQFIDEEMCASSVTQWMVPLPGTVKYEGGKDIQISELSTTGLGSYDAGKTDGSAYPQGAVTNKWRSYSLFMDRGVKFALDRTSPSDTGFMATAENVMREFARTQLARELDTYRITKLYNAAANGAYSSTNVFSGSITKENAVGELLKTLTAAQNSSEQLTGFVAIVNQELKAAFMEAANNTFSQISFGEKAEINGIEYENVMYVNDLACIFAPKSRMVTDVAIRTGRDGETEGGVTKSENGKYINFVVASYDAPLAVSKIDSLKQFPPEENQLFDGTAIQARYLYDLFVPRNKVCSVAVHAHE
ncbi:MAG: hypothetical protein IKU13_06260 [Clostridia bacterium]|nr:hypothetical protein [Clostridia bacterium]